MTAGQSGSTNYAGAPRQKMPPWLCGLTVCACLPIAGVVLLAIIAAPALRRIREQNRDAGRMGVCVSNVRQISTALQMYAQDYNDRLPPATIWMDASAPYVDNGGGKEKVDFRCPTVHVTNPTGYGYAFNSKLSHSALSTITNPSMMRLDYDSSNLRRNANDAVTSLPNPARHHGRRFRQDSPHVNVMGFADGHAKAVNEQGRSINVPGLDQTQP